MNVRHANRVTTPPSRTAGHDQPVYPRRSVALAAANRRRYGAEDRADLAALRASLIAIGVTADSPSALDADASRIAREEHWS